MPLTRDDVIASAAERLGKRTDLVTAMATEIVVVQTQLLEGHHWLPWFLEDEVAFTCTIDDPEVTLPDDFLLENDEHRGIEINVTMDTDQPWKQLTKDDLSILRQRYPGPSSAVPLAYALRGDSIILLPTPNLAYPGRINYFKRDDELSTNITNLWLREAADLVIAELCYLMAKDYVKDAESTQGFVGDVKRAWDRLYKKHIVRREAGGSRMAGDE